jgi:hypothetical protein
MSPRTTLQKQLIQKTSLGLLAGLTAWIGLLMYGSAQLRGLVDAPSGYSVAVGPFVLNILRKQETGQGFNATISFESGLLWFLIICAAIGLAYGLTSYKRCKN